MGQVRQFGVDAFCLSLWKFDIIYFLLLPIIHVLIITIIGFLTQNAVQIRAYNHFDFVFFYNTVH